MILNLFLIIIVFCGGVEIGARAVKYNIKQGLLIDGMLPYLVTDKFLRNIAYSEPFIDDGDCGSSICFYCSQDKLEKPYHREGCAFIEACEIIGKD